MLELCASSCVRGVEAYRKSATKDAERDRAGLWCWVAAAVGGVAGRREEKKRKLRPASPIVLSCLSGIFRVRVGRGCGAFQPMAGWVRIVRGR